MTKRRSIPEIREMKGKKKIAMLTAYDYPTAFLLDQAGLDILLVGDSVGSVLYGFDTTLPVTMDDMLRHTAAVVRGSKEALVVGDMPFGSYQPSEETAVRNAARFLAEGGAHAVKLEGGSAMAATVRKLVDVGIPVMGHVGMTPQSVHQQGGYRTVGKDRAEADQILADARAISQAGAFAVVLECIPESLAEEITRSLPIPTIGIGAGHVCDGEVLVTHDLLGLTVGHVPKFVTAAANLKELVLDAARTFVSRTRGESK